MPCSRLLRPQDAGLTRSALKAGIIESGVKLTIA
jgi:hypothetical protein